MQNNKEKFSLRIQMSEIQIRKFHLTYYLRGVIKLHIFYFEFYLKYVDFEQSTSTSILNRAA